MIALRIDFSTFRPMPEMILSGLPPAFSVQKEILTQQGENRANAVPKISAGDDLEAIENWLAQVQNPHTARQYRKEIERFLLWLAKLRSKSLSAATVTDAQDYARFLENPDQDWISSSRGHHRSSPMWRPFSSKLLASSIRQALVILSDCYAYLVTVRYLDFNIFNSDVVSSKQDRSPVVDRHLPDHLCDWIFDWLDGLAPTPRHIRWRFMVKFLFQTGLRAHEIVGAKMGDFERRIKDGKERWYLLVVGKGAKPGKIVVPDMRELVAYRRANNLPDYPLPGETLPLILPSRRRLGDARITPEALRKEFRLLRDALAEDLDAAAHMANMPDERARLAADALLVRHASPHWLRHAHGTRAVASGIPLRMVQMNMRHASISTTMIYDHTEQDAVHDAFAEKFSK